MKFKNILSMICNLAIVGLVGYSTYVFITEGGTGNMAGQYPFYCFFTFDSNILCAIAALLLLINNIINIFRKEASFSFTFVLLKMMGAVGVTLTFLVVMFWLRPTLGGDQMYGGVNLFLHFICPILGAVSFLFFETSDEFNISSFIMAIIPIIAYGVIYIYNTVFAGNWIDFYNFNFSGQWYFMIALVLAAAIIIAIIEIIIHNIVAKIDNAIMKRKSK